MSGPQDDCSPGEHPHSDRPNYTAADYLEMCRTGEAVYSEAEVCRLLGWSRAHLWRVLFMASVPEEIFEETLAAMHADGKPMSTTRFVDMLKRRMGKARTYVERCPHCGGVLRKRHR